MNNKVAIDWSSIDTVLLDMDGTLLDLHFDNHFWREHLPKRYAEKHSIALDQAKRQLYPRFKAQEGTMNWYCVDYWSQNLGVDIVLLKAEVAHLIAVHPHVIGFLKSLRKKKKRSVLVTNAHHKSLALKMKHTSLGEHLDAIFCAHDLGIPKENNAFWTKFNKIEPFNPRTTLLIDDNLQVLHSASHHGIKYLIAIAKPDSQSHAIETEKFLAIDHLGHLST